MAPLSTVQALRGPSLPTKSANGEDAAANNERRTQSSQLYQVGVAASSSLHGPMHLESRLAQCATRGPSGPISGTQKSIHVAVRSYSGSAWWCSRQWLDGQSSWATTQVATWPRSPLAYGSPRRAPTARGVLLHAASHVIGTRESHRRTRNGSSTRSSITSGAAPSAEGTRVKGLQSKRSGTAANFAASQFAARDDTSGVMFGGSRCGHGDHIIGDLGEDEADPAGCGQRLTTAASVKSLSGYVLLPRLLGPVA
jgi:hypothetical protein